LIDNKVKQHQIKKKGKKVEEKEYKNKVKTKGKLSPDTSE